MYVCEWEPEIWGRERDRETKKNKTETERDRCRSSPFPPFLQAQSPSLILVLKETKCFGLSSFSVPIPRELRRSWCNTLYFPLSCGLSQPYSRPSPFPSISYQYLKAHFTWNPQWPQVSGFQKNFQPGTTQPPHFRMNQRGQEKPRNKNTHPT